MTQIIIDGKEIDINDISEAGKANIGSLQFVQAEIKRLEAQIAVYKTAEVGYTNALKKELSIN